MNPYKCSACKKRFLYLQGDIIENIVRRMARAETKLRIVENLLLPLDYILQSIGAEYYSLNSTLMIPSCL